MDIIPTLDLIKLDTKYLNTDNLKQIQPFYDIVVNYPKPKFAVKRNIINKIDALFEGDLVETKTEISVEKEEIGDISFFWPLNVEYLPKKKLLCTLYIRQLQIGDETRYIYSKNCIKYAVSLPIVGTITKSQYTILINDFKFITNLELVLECGGISTSILLNNDLEPAKSLRKIENIYLKDDDMNVNELISLSDMALSRTTVLDKIIDKPISDMKKSQILMGKTMISSDETIHKVSYAEFTDLILDINVKSCSYGIKQILNKNNIVISIEPSKTYERGIPVNVSLSGRIVNVPPYEKLFKFIFCQNKYPMKIYEGHTAPGCMLGGNNGNNFKVESVLVLPYNVTGIYNITCGIIYNHIVYTIIKEIKNLNINTYMFPINTTFHTYMTIEHTISGSELYNKKYENIPAGTYTCTIPINIVDTFTSKIQVIHDKTIYTNSSIFVIQNDK